MSRPLTQLTKEDEKFIWIDSQQRAFDDLKAALTSESVLAHPRFDQPFILSTDASDYAISAILSQLHNGKERPISFASACSMLRKEIIVRLRRSYYSRMWYTNT